ncbi:MAG TPA: hypothetical protein ENJ09_01400 [Planctomycetes bacterium]|nr:hypothetical protein [Planctomycetota bacterium]
MGRSRTLILGSLGCFLLLEAMLVAAILFWPQFLDNMGMVRTFAKPIPVLSGMLDEIDTGGVFAYIAGQHFFKGCSTLGTAAAALFAAGAVAGEANRGTLEILLARPQSRARILAERYLAGLVAFALPVLLSSATIPALAAHVGESVSYRASLLGAVHETIFLAVIYGLAFLISTRASHPISVALGVIFTSVFCFAIYMVKGLSSYSPFRLADIPEFVEIQHAGRLDPSLTASMLAVVALLYLAAHLSFRKRLP